MLDAYETSNVFDLACVLRHGDMGKGCELLRRKNVMAAAKASKELMLELDPEGDDFEQVRASTRPIPETRNPKFLI